MKQVEIKKAIKNQMIEVAKIFKKSRLHSLPYLPTLHSQEEDINFFTDIVFKEQNVYIALDSKNKNISGFIAFDSKWINHLYIAPEFQNQGIGKSLLEIAKEKSSKLDLWTFQKNTNAQNFYLKNGFQIIKRTDGSENEEKEPDLLMSWKKNETDSIQIIERTDEPLGDILDFYKTQGYGGGANEEDRLFLTYSNEELICVVRIAVEQDVPVLRGMYMKEELRGKGLGKKILKFMEPNLNKFDKPSYCIPKAHLENFYSTIGFKKVENTLAPQFLSDRASHYSEEGHPVILMQRPGKTDYRSGKT